MLLREPTTALSCHVRHTAVCLPPGLSPVAGPVIFVSHSSAQDAATPRVHDSTAWYAPLPIVWSCHRTNLAARLRLPCLATSDVTWPGAAASDTDAGMAAAAAVAQFTRFPFRWLMLVALH